MRRRHYDPATARFLQPDPIAVMRPENYLTSPRALHPYAFVGNDPVNNADPTGMSFWSVVGAIAGAMGSAMVLAATFGFAAGVGLVGGLVMASAGVMTVAYAVADAAGGSALGEFARGFMIGLNAGLNLGLGSSAGMLGAFLAFEGDEFNLSTVKSMLGWSNLFMPMSWLATGVGLAFFATSVGLAAFTRNAASKLDIVSLQVDWRTGSIVTQGGLAEPANFAKGYNLGNFTFVHRTDSAALNGNTVTHEIGHQLNLAIFGGIFHFIGAIDENVWPARGARALSELYAESNATNASYPPGYNTGMADSWWQIWV
jgi:hypothetical protein